MKQGRIDYRMARRAVLRDVSSGLRSPQDVCDAHPDLVRAGRNIGSPVDDGCPVCDEHGVRHVTYIFTGKATKKGESGRAIPRDTLATQVKRLGDLNVFTVEVCTDCHWHHLLESFWLTPKDKAVG
ncbi:MAG: DUF5318 domain-containing protein [Actinobacteria bacterium]|nr:DUF5318 domain-containing protein [Actinomycetota bacterium]